MVDFVVASLLAIGHVQSLKIRESQKYGFEKVWLFDVKCGCRIKLPDMRTHLAREGQFLFLILFHHDETFIAGCHGHILKVSCM